MALDGEIEACAFHAFQPPIILKGRQRLCDHPKQKESTLWNQRLPPRQHPPAPPPVAAVSEDKTVAILSYLTLIGFIAAIIIHSNKKTQARRVSFAPGAGDLFDDPFSTLYL